MVAGRTWAARLDSKVEPAPDPAQDDEADEELQKALQVNTTFFPVPLSHRASGPAPHCTAA